MLYIFDWDGTIIDSADKIIHCMQRAADDAAIDVRSREEIRNIIGLGLPEAVASLYPDLSPDQRESLKANYVGHFLRKDVEPCALFPGVTETLEQLLDGGQTLAVATGKSRRGLERVWENLDIKTYFHASRCADETASKPHPLMLQELLVELSVAADEAVMVGDTEYDMAMARAISMPRIAVSYGAHRIERLQAFDPVLCVDEFDQVLEYY